MRGGLLAVTAAVTLASGCANAPLSTKKPYPEKPTESKALQMMHAATVEGIRDIDPQRLDDKSDGANVEDTRASILTASVFAAGDAAAPPLDLSPGLAGLLGFASWLNTGSVNPARRHRVIGWVPADAADSPKGAYERLHAELHAAVQKTIAHFDLPGPYRFTGKKHDEVMQDWIWPVSGGVCDTKYNCRYWYQYVAWDNADIVQGYAPELLGGHRAYLFTDGRDWPSFGVTMTEPPGGKWFGGLPDLRFYRRVSERLPAWMAIYLAPQRASFAGGPKSKFDWRLNQIPMVLHQGRVHLFVAPQRPGDDGAGSARGPAPAIAPGRRARSG